MIKSILGMRATVAFGSDCEILEGIIVGVACPKYYRVLILLDNGSLKEESVSRVIILPAVQEPYR